MYLLRMYKRRKKSIQKSALQNGELLWGKMNITKVSKHHFLHYYIEVSHAHTFRRKGVQCTYSVKDFGGLVHKIFQEKVPTYI